MKMNRWGHKWVHLLVGLFILYTTPLSDIIAINHSVNHQLFTDDIQLQKSAPLSEVTNPTKELNACTGNIKTWITKDQLKLNDNKTEALLFSFSSSLTPSTVSLPDSITLGSCNIPFSDSARNLGFILVSKLPMKKHSVKICQTAYFELKCISLVHMFLTEGTAKTLVTSSIPSLLDYCNGLFMGTPNSVIQPLQKIQNCAARLVLLAPWHHHSTPTLHLTHYTLLLTPACWKSNNTNARLTAFAPSLVLDHTFEIHSRKTLDTAQPFHLLKPNWKPSSYSIFIPTNIIT